MARIEDRAPETERPRWIPLVTIAGIYLVSILVGGRLAASLVPHTRLLAFLLVLVVAGVLVAVLYPGAVGAELAIGIVVAFVVQVVSVAVRGWADVADFIVAAAIYSPLFVGVPIGVGLGVGNGLARAADRRPRQRVALVWGRGAMLAVPFLTASAAFLVAFLVVAPDSCMTSATSALQRAAEHTTCTSPLGMTYSGGPGYQAPRSPAIAAGLVVAVAVGATTYVVRRRRERRAGRHPAATP